MGILNLLKLTSVSLEARWDDWRKRKTQPLIELDDNENMITIYMKS